jgi:hypothetical protein
VTIQGTVTEMKMNSQKAGKDCKRQKYKTKPEL